MSQSKLESFQQLARACGEVTIVGPLARQLPNPKGPVLGVDGGSQKGPEHCYQFTLGDGDSLTGPGKLDWLFPTDKDRSDLHLALAQLPAQALTIHLHGFWGGRFDHHMMNLGEVFQYLQKRPGQVIFYTEGEYQLWGLAAGKHQLQIQGLFSLFSPACARFSIFGNCRYQLAATELSPLSSQLLSNEGSGAVTIEVSQPFFCYLRAP